MTNQNESRNSPVKTAIEESVFVQSVSKIPQTNLTMASLFLLVASIPGVILVSLLFTMASPAHVSFEVKTTLGFLMVLSPHIAAFVGAVGFFISIISR